MRNSILILLVLSVVVISSGCAQVLGTNEKRNVVQGSDGLATEDSDRGRTKTISGFSTADVRIENFGYDGNGERLMIELRAASLQAVENVTVTLYQEETDCGGSLCKASSDETSYIAVGDTETVKFKDITGSSNSNTFKAAINFDKGGLKDIKENGTLIGNIVHEEATS